jgi:hypothetical protein
MQPEETDFPTTADLLEAARKHVAENFGGKWPEYSWLGYGPWDLNLHTLEGGQPALTAYPTDGQDTDTGLGIRIPVPPPAPQKRAAYFISQLERDGIGWIPCLAVEGETGYHRTSWRWSCDLETAEKLAAEKNEALGLSLEAATKIIFSSMGKVRHAHRN